MHISNQKVYAVESFLRDVNPATSAHSESETPNERRYSNRKKESEEKKDKVILSEEAKRILKLMSLGDHP